MLLLLSAQTVEMFDDPVGLASFALVGADGLHQIGRAAVMEEEDALPDAPQRSGSEFIGSGTAMCNAVGEAVAHVMDEKVGKEMRCLVRQCSARDR